MDKKIRDTFEALNNGNNFFLKEENKSSYLLNFYKTDPNKRLNDYDSNLLEEDAYKDLKDELLRLEYEMSKLQNDISSIDFQMISAREINDDISVLELKKRKETLINKYNSLKVLYNDKSLSTKISNNLVSVFEKKNSKLINFLIKLKIRFIEFLKLSMPNQLSIFFEVRNSLNKLESINKSLDDLVSNKVALGDHINKYEQLSKYIIKANSIQQDVSRFIK